MTGPSPADKRALLARLLKERATRAQDGSRGDESITVVSRDGELPLSFGQQRMWFLDQLYPGTPVYNLVFQIGLAGPLDVPALEQSLTDLIRRHESLRTSFPSKEGRATQRIGPATPWSVPVHDLRHLPAAEREQAAKATAEIEARIPFDLAAGPLLRTKLIRMEDQRYILVLIIHHIVSDGWSLNLMFQELGALYAARSTGSVAKLPDLSVQYADYADWHRRWLSGTVLEGQRSYWRNQLSGTLPELELPTDRRPRGHRTFEGTTWNLDLDAATTTGLRELSRREGVTLFMTLLTAFQVLLLRYSGQEDVIVGTLVSGRSRPEIANLIGFFVNALPVRVDLSGNPPFLEALHRTRERVVGAQANADFPFEKLIEEIQPDRDLARSPLFQVVFNMLSFGYDTEVSWGAVRARTLPSLEILTVTDGITLYGFDTRDRVSLSFVYSPDLFDRPTVARMAGHFHHLLRAVVATPDAPVLALPLLSSDERDELIRQAAGPKGEFPTEPYAEQFVRQARATPDRVAVTDGSVSLSYGELNARANAIANTLIEAGVAANRPVALLTERNATLVTWIIAVLKAGGAYLPLDPRHPSGRHAEVLRQSRAAAVLATDRLVAGLEEAIGTLDGDARPQVLVESTLDRLPSNDLDPPPRARSEDLAYIIFTSGSTGLPKGAMVPHRAMMNHFWSKINGLGITPSDTMVQSAPQGFDISVWQLLAVLLVGARVRIAKDEIAHDPDKLFGLVRAEGLTILEIVPSFLRSYLDELADPKGRGTFAALRWLILGGEALTPDLCRRWLELYPETPMMNGYGPSECADDVARHFITVPPDDNALSVPIGRPIHNGRIHVLETALSIAPKGVPGEICVGGTCVGSGYLNDPARTAAAFIPDPFGERPQAKLYRTGDRGRMRADGTLEYLGRVDYQVKIRGHRIELGEIEAVLLRHPGLREVTVHPWKSPSGDRLAAFVVAGDANAPPSVDELRTHARQFLPGYMVPDAFVALAAMPLSPNGKVDRAALPTPELPVTGAAVPPRTDVEARIASVWCELLSRERVGIHDNFFELGGHSLLATRVVSRLRASLGVDVPVRALFEGPTVAELAGRVEALRHDAVDALPLEPPPPGTADPTTLSFAQERMWLLHALAPESTAYSIPIGIRLRGHLHHGALASALDELRRRHEPLRTTFVVEGDMPRQEVQPWTPEALVPVDLRSLGKDAWPEAIRLAEGEVRRPFDLARGPVFRVTLFRTADEEHLLLLVLHHICADHWSLGIIAREIETTYRGGVSATKPDPLPSLPIRYRDFAAWQRRWLAGPVLEQQLGFWRSRLAGLSPLELPTDRPRPRVRTFRGATVSVPFPGPLAADLERLGQQHGTTQFMTLCAGLAVLLSRVTGQDDFAIGVPVANRNRTATEGLVGVFLNTLVLRFDTSVRPSFVQLLGQIRATMLDALARQDLPFERLVEDLGRHRDTDRPPLAQVLFNVPTAAGRALTLEGLTVEGVPLERGAAQFEWSITADPAQGYFALEYNTDLFDQSTVERHLRSFVTLLENLVRQPDTPVSRIEILTADERRRIVDGWNDTQRPYPADRCLHELIAEQVERTPDRIALSSGDEQLSYRQVANQATSITRRLRERGIGPGQCVAVLLDRSPDLVATLLGVLQTGAAYLPLDPEFPPARLDYMLADSAASVVVTKRSLWQSVGSSTKADLIDIDAQDDAIGDRDQAWKSPARPSDAAYLIYTSGSTGRPKAVIVSHRSLVNLLWSMKERPGLTPDDVLVAVTTASFDIAGLELYLPLLVGARIDLASRDLARDAAALAHRLERVGATVMQATPTTWHGLLEASWRGGPRFRALCGGEPLPVALAERLSARVGQLWNLYGPTETTIWSTVDLVEPGASAVTIGQPIANTRVYVLDREGQPQPVGVAGELWIGGDGVAVGYHNRPELTAERFGRDPFAPGPTARWYRTGDLARWRNDGRLEHLGRLDHQVKLRGYRIELGEIEAVLGSHPDVARAVVVVRAGGREDARLVGYIVPRHRQPSTADLTLHLKRQLPDYMVPTAIVSLSTIPTTPNGKVDWSALPDPTLDGNLRPAPFRAPQSELECAVAAIWQEVLRVPSVGLDDDFFDLGGHSLLATRIVARLRSRFAIELPVRTIFESPTVGSLARVIDGLDQRGAGVGREELSFEI